MNSGLRFCLICAAVTALLSIPQLLNRYKVEASNRAVELVVEYPDVLALAAATGRGTESVLVELKGAGVSGIVVYEDTVETLTNGGRLTRQMPQGSMTVWYTDDGVFRKLDRVLREKFGWRPAGDETATSMIATYGKTSLLYTHSLGELGEAGLGMPRSVCADLTRQGFDIVGRVGNYPGASNSAIDWTLRDLKDAGCSTVCYTGTEVLGARDSIRYAAERIKALGLRYAYVEFGKQAGDARTLAEIPESSLRLHSILPAEMVTMTPGDAIERYAKAARERNIRILYVRLMSNAGEDPVRANADYIRSLSEKLMSVGMAARPARPIADPGSSPFQWVVAIVGPLLGGLALFRLLGVRPAWALACVAPGLLADLAGIGPPHALAALMIAVLFPSAATMAVSVECETGSRAVLYYALASLVSFLAALGAASVISNLPFMVSASVFLGVKAVHVIPVVIVGLALLLRQQKGGGLGESVRWWHLMVAIAALAVVFLVVLRSGNENASVSGSEIQFRSLLDRVFSVRPRTKELLFGHPLLMIGLLLMAGKRTRLVPLFLAAGAIGQASIVNTFSHIHTPLLLSAMRVLNGAILGGILGVILYAVYTRAESWVLRKWSRSSS